MATNAAIHYTSAHYGTTTACARDIKKVACWDDFEAVTCKRCVTIETKRRNDELDTCAGLYCQVDRTHDIGASVDCRKAGAVHSGKTATEVDGLEPAGVQLSIHDGDPTVMRYQCGAGCPGFNEKHHRLDCQEPRVQLVMEAGHNLSATTGAAYPHTHKLQMLARAQRQVAELTKLYVQDARAAGLSWADIGEQLGVTKQAAQQRYGKS